MTASEKDGKDKVLIADVGRKSTEKKEKLLTKVIIRRLPPGIDKKSFLSQVSPLPDYDYIYSVKGDLSLGENAFSRVYINFVNQDDVFLFKEKFDNYVFIDTKGHEYPAVVEFSSFQKIPKKRGKTRQDLKCGSIENDTIFIEFLESLKEQPNLHEKPEYSYQPSVESKEVITTTPLLEYVKQRRIDKLRIKEEKREERKRKEIGRKKLREDERKKYSDEKPWLKSVNVKSSSASHSAKPFANPKESELSEKDTESEKVDEKLEKLNQKPIATPYYKNKERKYEDRKGNFKSKSFASDKIESGDRKNEFKYNRGEYRDKDKYKKEFDIVKPFTKKVKKYSERREERKIEAKKAEEMHNKTSKADAEVCEDSTEKKQNDPEEADYCVLMDDKLDDHEVNADSKACDTDFKNKIKDNDPRVQRRIRNKDRPTMAIYQPGMLSKRRCSEGGDIDNTSTSKVCDKE